MRYEFREIAPNSAAKVLSAGAFLISLLQVLVVLIFQSGAVLGVWMLLVMPFSIALLMYAFVYLACAVFNFSCRHLGGIEFEIIEKNK